MVVKIRRLPTRVAPIWRSRFPALIDRVVESTLATTIGDGAAMVSTTEHLLAALSGLGIDNALIELNGPEGPINGW